MRNRLRTYLVAAMTLCAFGMQSLAAFSPYEVGSVDVGKDSGLNIQDAKEIETKGVTMADTLHITPAMLHQMAEKEPLEEFKRQVESVVFVPKGQWITGISVSYNQSTQNKYQFLILEGVSGDTYSFKISPSVCYMFRDDMGAGLKFAYARSLAKLENADIVLGSESSYAADHVYTLSHNYYATMFFRNYFSIGKSKRFGFFNELQCQLGGGQSKFTRGVGEDLTGAYETNFSLDVGLVPGLCLFLSNYSALEASVGVLGFSYTNTKTLTDRIYVAHRKSKFANFKINLFSITFGVSFYL